MFAVRALGRARAGGSCSPATASGSSRSTTARRTASSRSPPSCRRCSRVARDRPRRARGVPRLQLGPGAADDLPGRPQAASPATCSSGRTGATELDALRAAGAGRRPTRCGTTRRPSSSRSCARACATRCARTSCRDVPVGVLLSGGIDSSVLAALAAEEVSRAASHVLDRLRGAELRRAGRRAARRRALRNRSPRARAAARRGPAPARARRGLRRAVRRLLGAPDLPRLAARGRQREGRALRRGRRRALRRLLHVRGRPARRAGRLDRAVAQAVRRAPALLERQGEPRLQGEALRPRRAPAGRSSATTAGRRSSRRMPGPSSPGGAATSTPSTCFAHGSRRPGARSCSRGSRTSISAPTSSTTCS